MKEMDIIVGNKYWVNFGGSVAQAKVIRFDGVVVEYVTTFEGRYRAFTFKMRKWETKKSFISRLI